MPALPGYYTTKEAAEKLGYKTPDSLRQYCAQGKIPGAQNIGPGKFHRGLCVFISNMKCLIFHRKGESMYEAV